MKKAIWLAAVLAATVCLTACGQTALRQKLCDGAWVSSVDVLEFTSEGRVLHNFESPEDSVSYYKLDGKKINLYTEEGEEYGMTFDISIEGDTLMLGKVEYTRYVEPSVEEPSTEGDTDNANGGAAE